MVEAKSYAQRKTVAEKVAPRAIFDAGHREGISFRDNLIASDMVLSRVSLRVLEWHFWNPGYLTVV